MKIYPLIIFIFLLGIISCSTKIELEIPHSTTQIVVNSLITNDSLIKINISKTTPMLSNESKTVNNAKVELWADDQFIENLELNEEGIYQSSVPGVIGVNYKIYADVSGFDRIFSSARIPASVYITEGYIKEDSYYDQQQMNYVSEVEVSFYDPPQVENYYQVNFYSYSYNPEYEYDSITGTVIAVDSTISYQGIYYLNSKDPVIINEGDLQYYDDSGYIRSLVFSDELLDEESSIKFLVKMAVGEFSTPVVILRNISYDYYKYKKSWIRQAFNQGLRYFYATDIFYAINPNDLYTNIENGLGIFAGYSETHFELEEIE